MGQNRRIITGILISICLFIGNVWGEPIEGHFDNSKCTAAIRQILMSEINSFSPVEGYGDRDCWRRARLNPNENIRYSDRYVKKGAGHLYLIEPLDNNCNLSNVKAVFTNTEDNNATSEIAYDLSKIIIMNDGSLWGRGYWISGCQTDFRKHKSCSNAKTEFICYGNNCTSQTINSLLKSGKINANDPWPESIKAEILSHNKANEKSAALAKIKKTENEKAAKETARKFIKLGNCEVGETVYHREAWNSKTSSGNFLADALFNASVKEEFIIVFEGIVKGKLGNKIEVYLQDYTVKQTRGGGILQPATDVGNSLTRYADKRIGKSHFFDKSRCGN